MMEEGQLRDCTDRFSKRPKSRGGGEAREELKQKFFTEDLAMIGYSIYIYHIGVSEANDVRAQLGLYPVDDRATASSDNCF